MMSEWQPICTAPKDGTPIEVKHENGDIEIAQWEENRCCMLGPRAGAYGAGWQNVEIKLPIDPPILWRPQ